MTPEAEPRRAETSRAEPGRAESSRAEPGRAELSRAGACRPEPSRAELGRAELRRAEPSRAERNRADSSRKVRNRAETSRAGGDPRDIFFKTIMFYNELLVSAPPSQNISFYDESGNFAIKTILFTMNLIARSKQFQNHAKTQCFTMNSAQVSKT